MSAEKVTTTEKTAIGVAYSKLILIGEHAVVHGQPAIAIPFPLVGVETVIEHLPGPVKIDTTFYHGSIAEAPKSLEGIVKCVEETLDYLNIPCQDMLIRITSSIPPGKGLGSSASVAISVVRSLFAYFDETYTDEELLRLANIAETFAHGAPSGIDTLTITSQSPVWYEKEHPINFIKLSEDFHFVVADSGRVGDTRLAVESVANLLKKAPKRIQRKLERIGKLTHDAKQALEKKGKHILGHMLNEAQKELEALGVSDTGLNRLIDFARQEGALGAKLTGGGNGGCIIALAQNEVHSRQLAEKLRKFGAHAVWPFVLKESKDQ
ncbi:mevalonate kinase [Virgibacillus pantothenticus]|uniref:mevalonate kinase n=1 Tax=Virgibacillus pantothenticus TaxID=1473 RepID=A0A0L0QUH5_VIRPA|nr:MULTISPECIES: mevalonate kinase [Virgibacillus]API92491.1 mevalonate kinase [Virgibacillus sp. 6R]KNE22239.1 mevalonate kinase [Virgibacillus pantothenticus]MBS7427958.1 mevalonate kinase [Virgibacillus sp. 19R1-5]MBU8568215.1 mevalonate kinase [Virgibacillus pantothenticus]MBU8601859.1 mevalonate kinase [Virgibacillus pantothenticus]